MPVEFANLTITVPYNDPPAIKEVFAREGREIAAVIVESVPANAGLYLPRPGFVELLRDLCTEHDTVFIFDEVMTGFRLARGGYQEICGVMPDLTALGKVIGGGLPVGAFGGRREIMDYLSPDGPVYQAGTLSGNPLAMAAGLAQLRELERLDGWKGLEELGAAFEDGTRSALKKAGKDYFFNRIGSMFCTYFTSHQVHRLSDAMDADRDAFSRYFHQCLERGIYFAPSQFEAGFLSLAHTPDDLARTAAVVAKALTA